MLRFSAFLSLCVFVGLTQSADAQTRSGNGTFLDSTGTRKNVGRAMPAPNQRFVQDAVRRAQERRARMQGRKQLRQSIARPTVPIGPSAMFSHAFSNALRSISYYSPYGSYGDGYSGNVENYYPPYLYSPIYGR